MLTVETVVFDCICWFSSSRDRNGQSYQVELSVEEYSEGKIHKGEPETMERKCLLLIRPAEILESVPPSLFTMK